MDYPITILGTFGSKKYADLKRGVSAVLLPEDTNAADPDAVAVYLGDEPCGYVGNSPKTILQGCMSAKKLRELMGKPEVAKTACLLVEDVPLKSPSNQMQKRFYAKAFFVPKRETGKKKKPKTAEYSVKGATARYPRNVTVHGELQKAIDAGKKAQIPVTVRCVDSKYIVREDGQTVDCGVLDIVDKNDKLVKWLGKNPEIKGVTTGELLESPDPTVGPSFPISVTFEEENRAEYNSLIDEAICRGAGQEKELQEKLQTMLALDVTKPVIKDVLGGMVPQVDNSNVPGRPERPYQSKTSTLNDALVGALMCEPMRLVGDKGSGKNTLIETICWLLNRAMVRIQGSVELDKMDLLGSPQLVDGNLTFQLSPVMKALQTGATVVIDEANLIRPDVLGILHSATDNARSVLVPGYGPVKLHPNAQIVYTMNEGYTGTGDMNEATVDRALTYELEPEVELVSILDGFPKKNVDVAQKVSNDIRKAVSDGTLGPDAITVRGYIAALKMAEKIPLKRALVICVAGKTQDKASRKAVENIIELAC